VLAIGLFPNMCVFRFNDLFATLTEGHLAHQWLAARRSDI
jgi:hypothetical protein